MDAIVAHSIVDKLLTFCVKWVGSYENSWHELIDLENCQDKLSQYLLTQLTDAQRAKVWRAFTPQGKSDLPHKTKELMIRAARSHPA